MNDGGEQENVFNMSQSEMKQRQIGLYSGNSLKVGVGWGDYGENKTMYLIICHNLR
jgi:hypothetical protein